MKLKQIWSKKLDCKVGELKNEISMAAGNNVLAGIFIRVGEAISIARSFLRTCQFVLGLSIFFVLALSVFFLIASLF